MDALIKCLADPDVMIRVRAIAYLEQTKSPRAVEALLPLLNDGNAQVRQSAARTLGNTRDPRAADALLALYEKEPPPGPDAPAWQNPRAAILGALAATRDPKALDALLKGVSDPTPAIRTAAETGLRDFRDPRVPQALLAALKAGGGMIPTQVQVPVMEQVPPGPGEKGPKQVMKGMKAEMRDFEDTALLFTLREVQDVALVEALAAAAGDPKLGATAKKGVAIALGKTDDPRCVTPLLALAKDPDAGLRAAVARALPPDPRCLDTFAALLADADKAVVRNAAARLAGDGGFTTYGTFGLVRKLSDKAFQALLAASQATIAAPEGGYATYTVAGALVKTRDPRAAAALLAAYEKAEDPMKKQLSWLLWSARTFAAPDDAARIRALVGEQFQKPTQF